jgi:spermidine/putrescine transport system substrate-binding protein
MAYNGDALRMREFAPGIRYVMPTEGGIIWVDNLVLGAKSRAPRQAEDLINFLLAENNLLRLATYSRYAPASERITQRMPASLRNHPDIVPSAARLRNFALDIDTDVQSARQRNRIFAAISR